MKYDKTRIKSLRIFHDKESKDFEYVVFILDKKNYLIKRRAIYNQVTEENTYLVDWIREQGVEPEELNFEEFLGKSPKPSKIPDNAKPHEIEFKKKINHAKKTITERKFKDQYEYSKLNKGIEVIDDFLFDKDLGLFLKTKYQTYETKQFNPQLGALITFSIHGTNDVILIKKWYQFFKDFTFLKSEKILDFLFNQHRIYREELSTEPDELLESICPILEKKHHVFDLIKYEFLELIIEENEPVRFLVSGNATWDIEHGFRFVINEHGEIEEE